MKPIVMLRLKYLAIALMFQLVSSCSSSQNNAMQETHLYEESESLNDVLTINQDAVTNLRELLNKEKFGPEERSEQLPLGYVGFLPPESRPTANKLLNESISRLIQMLEKEQKVTKRLVLDEFEKGLNSFNELASDTEDRERVCWYYEDIMDIIGLESTNELLNNWMY